MKLDFEKTKSIFMVTEEYNKYSIFKSTAAKDLRIYEMLNDFKGSAYKDDILVNRAIGSIMAHAIGDSMGSVLEFQACNYSRNVIKDFDQSNFNRGHNPDIVNSFGLKVGQYTDDFSMGLCLADSLLCCNGIDCCDLRLRFLRWWLSGYNNAFRFDTERHSHTSVGLGGNIAGSFQEAIEEKKITEATDNGDTETSGNGSIMRLSPVALYYHYDVDTALDAAARQSRTTHKGTEAADCCRILSFIIIKALHNPNICKEGEKGFAKKFLDELDIKSVIPKLETETAKVLCSSQVEKDFKKSQYCDGPKDRDWNWKAEHYQFSPTRVLLSPGYIGSYAMDGLAMALHCVYSTNSVGEAVMKASNLGGDADSLAAVTGQMAGAIYGITNINPVWSKHVMQWDNQGEIALRALCMIKKELRNHVLEKDCLINP